MVIEYSDNSFEFLDARLKEQRDTQRASFAPTDNYQRLAHLVINRDGDALVAMAKRNGVDLSDEMVRGEIIYRVRELRGIDPYGFDEPIDQEL